MAIKYLDGGRITGLSTDVKPTDIPTGSSFVETDSGAKLVYNGTTWIYDTFESINDAFGKSGGVTQSQHFVEWFTGNALDTNIWGKDTDDGTVAMSDSVNGGVILTTGAGLYNSVCIGFAADSTSGNPANVPLCFNSQGAVIQFVEQWGTATSGLNTATNGFHSERRGDNAGNNACAMELGTWNTNYQLRTCNSVGAQTDTDSGISAAGGGSISTNKNFFRVEIQPTFATMSINGVLGSTNAGTNLPSGGLAPCFGIQNHSTGGASILHVIYCEAWNH